jgi:DNA helicase-2/ATP-dependent DNA helicase PcrA
MISASVSEILKALNPEQREAVTILEGPLLILAGPGSGKTRVITHKIAYLLAQGVSAHEILGVTFTNKAAEEMKTRVQALLGEHLPLTQMPWIHTFHATCARILRAHIARLSPHYSSSFSILDEGDQREVLARTLKELDISTDEVSPAACAAIIERAKDELIGPEAFRGRYAGRLEPYRLEVLARVYARYQQRLMASNALDFGDLLRLTVELFRRNPEILAQYRQRFRFVLVDEYQDINHAQYVFTRLLAEGAQHVAVVGDEDQAIFSWRGSDPSYLLRFAREFPDARVIELTRHYRWPRGDRIFKAARRLIEHNVQRLKKRADGLQGTGEPVRLLIARDELSEAQAIVREIERLWKAEGIDLSQIAVLYRVNTLSRVIEEALLYEGIPYEVVRGLRFYERREVKDLLAYLRFLANSDDEISLLRALQRPRRGLGEATLAKLQQYAAVEKIPLWEAMRQLVASSSGDGTLRPKQAEALRAFVALMEELLELRDRLSLPDLAQTVLERSGYLSELSQLPDREERIGNVRELIGLMVEYERRGGEGLVGFLEQVALLSDVDSYSGEAGRVALMTLHASKGLEFDVVFIVGLEEGLLPHARSVAEGMLEEERRLLYVGMTRARWRLYLSLAHQRSLYGTVMLNGPSRFLSELPEEDFRIAEGELSPL